jgi:hypothetical protein
MRIKRFVVIASLSVLTACTAKGMYSFAKFHAVERDFAQVKLGQPSGSVIQLLGRPNYHSGACLEDLKLGQDCVNEFVYSHPFAPLVPEYYVVDFSADRKVIGADHLISP